MKYLLMVIFQYVCDANFDNKQVNNKPAANYILFFCL